ncbi:hypothetical protein OOU_Y34scaffold00962g3 [Pyricularia oryzae Y34]|uniref:Uncharacterized protein n=2 Tax=Pyricularia oryzae TaxID=318829 RepID=Q2KGW9_PYRO7|nr:hypothetical protein MGCH7_ch7g216 [Pyricularia oryzae 70-15]ELQ33379.1 hypothetical protein OOU_Y34scaffold00962g3 [Pyricularia oryzae Y34]
MDRQTSTDVSRNIHEPIAQDFESACSL